MGLLEEIEEDKKKLAELDGQEPEADVEQEQPEEEQEEPETKPEETGEEPENKEKPNVEEKPDNAAYARMRRENAALEKRLRELESRGSEPVKQPEPVKALEQEPDMSKDPIAWIAWKERQRDAEMGEFKAWKEEQVKVQRNNEMYEGAKQELASYENQFRTTVDDYDAVSNHYISEIKRAIKVQHPSFDDAKVLSLAQNHVLMESARYAASGLNPIEELYHVAKNELGYQPAQEASSKPSLETIAKNKSRSSGMAAASGSTRRAPVSSMEAAAAMSPYEWSKLSQEEKARILGGN